jgi:hypothetical protein
MKKNSRKKAQVWSLDFIIAIVFFAISLTIYFKYAGQIFDEEEMNIEELRIEAASISSSLMTPGYPLDWNESNVERIGISTDGSTITQAKLDSLMLISSDYENTRRLFSASHQYYIELSNNSTDISISGMQCNSSAKRIATAERIVLYNNSIFRLSVCIWER